MQNSRRTNALPAADRLENGRFKMCKVGAIFCMDDADKLPTSTKTGQSIPAPFPRPTAGEKFR